MVSQDMVSGVSSTQYPPSSISISKREWVDKCASPSVVHPLRYNHQPIDTTCECSHLPGASCNTIPDVGGSAGPQNSLYVFRRCRRSFHQHDLPVLVRWYSVIPFSHPAPADPDSHLLVCTVRSHPSQCRYSNLQRKKRLSRCRGVYDVISEAPTGQTSPPFFPFRSKRVVGCGLFVRCKRALKLGIEAGLFPWMVLRWSAYWTGRV